MKKDSNIKAIKCLLKKQPVFLNRFSNNHDVSSNYEVDLSGVNILFAQYAAYAYEGSSWVLFEQNGKLYEVNGNHCSFYGLEGQWEPEECTIESLKYRIENGRLGESDDQEFRFADELKKFLEI